MAPLTLDTGAPGTLYLGSKTLYLLNKMVNFNDMSKMVCLFTMHVNAKLNNGHAILSEVYIYMYMSAQPVTGGLSHQFIALGVAGTM